MTETQLANRVTEQIIEEIAGQLRPGMTETQGRELTKRILEKYKAQGVVKQWHIPVVNYGVNTANNIADRKKKPDQVLHASDIVYIDIGPVLNINGKEIEGDVGRTFVFGDNPLYKQLQQASKAIFDAGVAYWKETQPTGTQLYAYLKEITHQQGFEFNLEEAGHLIGSFPHHYAWRDGLSHYNYVPEAGIWIMEIQIRHPKLPYGAFYEAILQ